MEIVQELLKLFIVLGLGAALGMGISAYHDVKEWYK